VPTICQAEPGDTEPAGRACQQTIDRDEGEHEHNEACQKDDLGRDEDRIPRRFKILALVECPHHDLRAKESAPAVIDSQPAYRTKGAVGVGDTPLCGRLGC
jgi:hypothetical protein